MTIMKPLYLNESTKLRLERLAGDLPQGLLLQGISGVGLSTIAKYLSKDSLVEILEPRDSKGLIDHCNGIIGVNTIRDLYTSAKVKSRSKRTFIIDDADRMTVPAQNAFLKLLEEPTSSTRFILTSHDSQALLPTVRSRLEVLNILPISDLQTQGLVKSLQYSATETNQIMFIASGRPAEILRLVDNRTVFNQKIDLMKDAKALINGTKIERLSIAYAYANDRQAALSLVEASLSIVRASIHHRPSEQLVTQADVMLKSLTALRNNCNVRLQLVATVV